MRTKPYVANVHERVPIGARELIWEVFFASRCRGLNLETHFPWLNDEVVVTVTLADPQAPDHSETVAALVLKADPVQRIGLVGLVCVREDCRGIGLSSVLLNKASEVAGGRGIDCLVLWTNKPEVYISQGFAVDSNDVFGTVKLKQYAAGKPSLDVRRSDEVLRCGIPAFATGIERYASDDAVLTLLRTPNGMSVVAWSGTRDAVADLFEQVLPAEFSLNAQDGDSLLEELSSREHVLTMCPSSFRMVKWLPPDDARAIPYINLLDRI